MNDYAGSRIWYRSKQEFFPFNLQTHKVYTDTAKIENERIAALVKQLPFVQEVVVCDPFQLERWRERHNQIKERFRGSMIGLKFDYEPAGTLEVVPPR